MTTSTTPFALALGPRDGVTVVGPKVAVAIDVDLGYLATTGADVASVIEGVAQTVADVVNATAPTLPLAVAILTDFVRAVPGVFAVRSLTLNGRAQDLAASGTAYLVLPTSIATTDVRIVANAGGPSLVEMLRMAGYGPYGSD